MIESKYKSRKWLAFKFGAISNIGLLVFGFLSGGQFVTLQSLLFAFYKAANVAEGNKS